MLEAPKNLEEAYVRLGGCGLYQILLGFITVYSMLVWVAEANKFTFGTLEPTYQFFNQSEFVQIDRCNLPANATNVTKSSNFYSFVEEWNLDCDLAYVPNMLESLQNAALMISCFVGGHLADHFGRKWTTLGGLTVTVFIDFFAAFSTSWQMYAVFAFFSGLAQGIWFCPQVVIAMELIPKEHRIMIQSCFQYSVAYGVSALIGYLTKNWRIYSWVSFGLCFPLLIGYWLLLIESPHWLIQKGRIKDAHASLARVAKINRKTDNLPREPAELEKFKVEDKSRKYTFLHLFQRRDLAIYTVVQSLLFFINQSIITFVIYGVGAFAGNPFLNIAIYGLARLWVPFVLIWFDIKVIKFGRKALVFGSFVFVTLCLVANAGIILSDQANDLKILSTVLALLAATVNAGLLSVGIYTWCTELYPTPLRNIAQSTLDTVGMLAQVLGPQILFLRTYWTPAPYVVIGALCLINLPMILFLLPETKGIPLPEAFEEIQTKAHAEEYEEFTKF